MKNGKTALAVSIFLSHRNRKKDQPSPVGSPTRKTTEEISCSPPGKTAEEVGSIRPLEEETVETGVQATNRLDGGEFSWPDTPDPGMLNMEESSPAQSLKRVKVRDQ